MHALTVYCASSESLHQSFHDMARIVGQELARRGVTIVYGGGSVGLMGELARAARAEGGRVKGIITEFLVRMERADTECDELIVVKTMRERKRLLAEQSDGFIVLPGGLGTYEEFFETIVARHLGEHERPIGVVNTQGYYDPLVEMVNHGIEHGFIRDRYHDLVFTHQDPMVVIEHVHQQILVA